MSDVPGMSTRDSFERRPPDHQLKVALARHRTWLAMRYPHAAISERDEYLDRFGVIWPEEDLHDPQPASFVGVDFVGVDLSGATLFLANLTDANLNSANLDKADLNGAILNRSDLTGATMRGAGLIGAELRGADLTYADLSGAKLMTADLTGATLVGADFTDADLSDVKLREADLEAANFTNAVLAYTDMRSTRVNATNLKNARLANADLTEALYAPTSDAPNADVVGIRGLSRVKLLRGKEVGMVQLRKLVQDAGLRDTEREATYSIERSRTSGYVHKGVSGRHHVLEAAFRTAAFDWTTAYGKNPGRALLLMFILALVCVPLYWWPIYHDPGPRALSGIYEVFPKDRLDGTASNPTISHDAKAVRVHATGREAIAAAAYFSIISAANLGFNQFTPGDWLRRLQPRESLLEAAGWVRVVAGAQALLSLYLLAICVLTYFGRPFQ